MTEQPSPTPLREKNEILYEAMREALEIDVRYSDALELNGALLNAGYRLVPLADSATPTDEAAEHVYCSTCNRFIPIPDRGIDRLRAAYDALVAIHARCADSATGPLDVEALRLVEEMRQSFLEARDSFGPDSDAWLVWHTAASNLSLLADRIRLLPIRLASQSSGASDE